jgi:Protein of unknown function (DUF3024)
MAVTEPLEPESIRTAMDLPQHTARLAAARLARYCEQICDPAFTRQVRLGYRIEGRVATLFEVRPAYCTTSDIAVRECDVARFAHDPRDGYWRFHYFLRDGGWRRYRRLPRARDILVLLREIDRDPAGLFWGHLNGASLRWCTANGRCATCEFRYRAVLGPLDGAGRGAMLRGAFAFCGSRHGPLEQRHEQ